MIFSSHTDTIVVSGSEAPLLRNRATLLEGRAGTNGRERAAAEPNARTERENIARVVKR